MARGKGARLNDEQRVKILNEMTTTGARSNRAIARAHGIDESAVRQLWKKRDKIIARTSGVAAAVLASRARGRRAWLMANRRTFWTRRRILPQRGMR